MVQALTATFGTLDRGIPIGGENDDTATFDDRGSCCDRDDRRRQCGGSSAASAGLQGAASAARLQLDWLLRRRCRLWLRPCGTRTTTVVTAGSGGPAITQPINNGGKGWYGAGARGLRLPDWPSARLLLEPEYRHRRFRGLRVCGWQIPFAALSAARLAMGGEVMPWTWAAGARAGFLVTPKFLIVFRWRLHPGEFQQREFPKRSHWRCNCRFLSAANTLTAGSSAAASNMGSICCPVCSSRPSIAIRATIRRTLPVVVTATGAATPLCE